MRNFQQTMLNARTPVRGSTSAGARSIANAPMGGASTSGS